MSRVAVVCLFAAGCAVPAPGEGESAAPKVEVGRATIPIGAAPAIGPESAPVTVVVYSDFECPFCRKGADRLKAVRETYGDQVRVVFKQRPLPFHRFARPAARGSIAAGKQGKFWEYHDRLFAAERGFDDALFEETARVIGLDLDRWKRDYASAESEAVLAADEAEAQALEVRGTPTFFVNGKMIQGAQPIEEFERLIDAELAAR